MMRIIFAIAASVLLTGAVFAQAPPVIVLADEDHESVPVGGLPFPPYNLAAFQWDQSACCDGQWSVMVSNVRAAAGSNSLTNINQIVSNGVGASVDAQIRIPVEYRPLSSATFRLWRYVSRVVSSGVVTMTISGDPDVGLMWTNDGTVLARLGANDNRVIWFQTPGTWAKWQLDYDFVNKILQIRVFDDPIASFQLSPSVLNNPWTFILGSNIGGSGQADNQFFDDNVYAAITPLCDPAEGDCNGNGVADRCDLDPDQGGNSLDCNTNTVPDECDIAADASPDCNGNTVPDECDIASGFSTDTNSNGVPDECDVIIVNSLADPGVPDDGLTTLREAITAANNGGGFTITFDPALAGGTIQPTSQLPDISGGDITINGDIDGNGTPDIELDGFLAGAADGVRLHSAGNSIIGLVINRFEIIGIRLWSPAAAGNTISFCYIGTNAQGTEARPNGSVGIWMQQDTSANQVGPGNVISGNQAGGIAIDGGSGHTVFQNMIGVDRLATHAIPNANGVWIRSGITDGTIGPDNIISGNTNEGVLVSGAASSNQVLQNIIGTDASGATAIPNGRNGIVVGAGAFNNTIGPGNVVSGNVGSGIQISDNGSIGNIVTGNLVGVASDGSTALGNVGHAILVVNGATGNVIGPDNVISGNGSWGVVIRGVGTSGNQILGNMIGTDIGGTTAVPNIGFGVAIDGGASGNTVGPSNLISGNSGIGVWLVSNSNDNQVFQNRIGTDWSGMVALGNTETGVLISASSQNTIGPNNIISGNGNGGIAIIGISDSNTIVGNFIGVDSTGSALLGNFANGITIWNGPTGTIIGGAAESDRNIISGNGASAPFAHGIVINSSHNSVVVNNYVGTDVSGTMAVPNNGQGLVLENGSTGNTIGPGNVISGNTFFGVLVSGLGSSANTIRDNLIGTDASGGVAVPNGAPGVMVTNDASGNIIGPGNVISGNNSVGLVLEFGATANQIIGNKCGTDITGSVAIPNLHSGILIQFGGHHNTIGGSGDGKGNLCSGNRANGITVRDAGSDFNMVKGNFVGINATGDASIPNEVDGVSISNGASHNIIGPGNRLIGNQFDGVFVVDPQTFGNSISQNSITANGQFGIHLANAANGGISPPRLIAQVGETLHGESDHVDGGIIEVFSDPGDQGLSFIGSTTVVDGRFILTSSLLNTVDNVMATVTDLSGNTSEFSVPLNCFGNVEDPDSDGDGIPDQCDVPEDCNGNGVLDVDEINGAQSTSVFASGMRVPEDIVASAGSYPSGFYVPDAIDNVLYHVGALGGTATAFTSSVGSMRGAVFVPDAFGGHGDRLIVAAAFDIEQFHGVSLFGIAEDGSVTPFATLAKGVMANGLVYVPQDVGGQVGGKLFVVSQRADFPVHLVGSDGLATAIVPSLDVGLFTPALAPSDFGDFGNHVFATTVVEFKVYAFDPVTLASRLFASVPSSGGSSGLRQLAFSPVGWAAPLNPTLSSERVLLVSVASGGSSPFPGTGTVSVWDQRGKQVAVLRSGPEGPNLEPRGLLFVGDELLISDIADGHGWLIRASVEDFGKGDCDADRILDECELNAGALDCNANRVPDACDADCNANGIPDQCDIAGGTASDCNGNFIPDTCEFWPDCNANGLPDSCDLADGTSQDCNADGIPDSCELVSGFPVAVVENTTGFPDWFFAGAPDPQIAGIAGRAVTFDFGTARFVIDLPGPDLSVYEGGGPEFDTIDVLVSEDGVDFVSIRASEVPHIRIPGDEISSGGERARSYDLSGSGISAVRFVRIDGNGDEAPVGGFDGFDLNAIGAIHLDGDCDGDGTPDECQKNDFDGDGFIDPCDNDIDNDGVGNDADVCDFTPPGVPTDQHGRPRGDWDGDCTVTLADYELFAVCLPLSGPNVMHPFSECLTVFDSDDDGDVDLKDACIFQRAFTGGP